MIAQAVFAALSSFEEPPTVTDLRFLVAERTGYPPEEVRTCIFGMIQTGVLHLTPNLHVYRP